MLMPNSHMHIELIDVQTLVGKAILLKPPKEPKLSHTHTTCTHKTVSLARKVIAPGTIVSVYWLNGLTISTDSINGI